MKPSNCIVPSEPWSEYSRTVLASMCLCMYVCMYILALLNHLTNCSCASHTGLFFFLMKTSAFIVVPWSIQCFITHCGESVCCCSVSVSELSYGCNPCQNLFFSYFSVLWSSLAKQSIQCFVPFHSSARLVLIGGMYSQSLATKINEKTYLGTILTLWLSNCFSSNGRK